MSEVLDLSGADMKGFAAIPSGRYPAVVQEVKAFETDNPEGKLPVGTPGWNVQFKVDGGEHDNARVFNRYYNAPAGYEKKAMMDGFLARFLIAIGAATEKDIAGGKAKINPADWEGCECTVVVKKRPADVERGYDESNTVSNVLPRSASVASDDSDLL
jgi:hypothetical protein